MEDSKTNPYCRLETYCFFDIKQLGFLKQEKSLAVQKDSYYDDVKDYDVYAEEYNDLESVLSRISQIEEEWIKKNNLEKNRNYWEFNENDQSAIGDSETSCISVIIYNKWNNEIYVGMCFGRWMIVFYSDFTNECKENLQKAKNRKPRSMVLYLPQYTDFYDYQFISKEKVSLLIEEWLETDCINKDSIEGIYGD
jgi:hypothetical protein